MTEPDDRILASRELFSEVDLPDDEGPAAFYLTGMTHDELEVTPPTALRWLSQLTPASVADLLCAISASEGWGYELLALRCKLAIKKYLDIRSCRCASRRIT
jgi:hypothetical protein